MNIKWQIWNFGEYCSSDLWLTGHWSAASAVTCWPLLNNIGTITGQSWLDLSQKNQHIIISYIYISIRAVFITPDIDCATDWSCFEWGRWIKKHFSPYESKEPFSDQWEWLDKSISTKQPDMYVARAATNRFVQHTKWNEWNYYSSIRVIQLCNACMGQRCLFVCMNRWHISGCVESIHPAHKKYIKRHYECSHFADFQFKVYIIYRK